MTVDFVKGTAPAFVAATVAWGGEYSEKRVRKEFEELAAWVTAAKLRAGRWFFMSHGERRWVVGIEVRGGARGSGKVRVRRYPKRSVVRVSFDPDAVSPRVVYHGLTDHLRWEKRSQRIRSVGDYREVYRGNPWKDASAWSHLTVEAIVRS